MLSPYLLCPFHMSTIFLILLWILSLLVNYVTLVTQFCFSPQIVMCKILNSGGWLGQVVDRWDFIYWMSWRFQLLQPPLFCILNSALYIFYLWHSHLEHVSSSRLKHLVCTRVLSKLQIIDISYCFGCKVSQFIILPFTNSVSTSHAPFDFVHYDV